MPESLPKTIWMLWLQGWDRAPRIVKACRRSWECRNPGWTVRCLDATSAAAFIGDREACAALDHAGLPPEACSDRLRIALLAQHGGVWADATTYCLQPLDAWLPDVVGAGFFAFHRPGPDRLISSWFLAATRNNGLVQRWSESTAAYWRGRTERDHYFWFHYLFGAECETDPAFLSAYEAMPKVSADGPHAFVPQDVRLWATATERDKRMVEFATEPLLKLSHRLPSVEYPPGSVAAWLCERVGA